MHTIASKQIMGRMSSDIESYCNELIVMIERHEAELLQIEEEIKSGYGFVSYRYTAEERHETELRDLVARHEARLNHLMFKLINGMEQNIDNINAAKKLDDVNATMRLG
jgi:hypothetical protein